jgi:LytS/YehU family sensor histidine kinase
LNPLVENAVKHGAPMHADEPLRIRVRGWLEGAAGPLRLVVENSGVLLSDGHATAQFTDITGNRLTREGGVGLQNVRTRLAHHYGDAGQLTITAADGMVRVALLIPVATPMARSH